MNYAYVTLLSSMDYILPVLALNQNFKEINSQYPLYVMITEDIYDKASIYLKKESINYIKVPVIKYSDTTINNTQDKHILLTASKLNIFNLYQFNKVIYIDADCLLLKNIDELFNYPDGAMYDEEDECGFSGLFVCTPQNHPIDYYISLLQSNRQNTMWDGDLLGNLWFPFKTNLDYRIPYSYFINITTENLEELRQTISIYGIHFCYKYKPWRYNSSTEFIKDYTTELKNYGTARIELVEFYIQFFIKPLKNKYPELF